VKNIKFYKRNEGEFMIFESHAHYDDRAFDEDREKLLAGLEENGIGTVVNVSSDLESVEKTIALTKQYPFVYGAVGIHPSDTGALTEENFAWLWEQCKNEKVVAVGEIGLDYHWKEPEVDIQKKWFRRQIGLAREMMLPVIIHSREAARDTITIMREEHAEETGGVVHCYSYSKEMAAEFLKLGYYFGIGGVVTFDNGKKLREAVKYIPLDQLLLETDSPYLAPAPVRGKRNSSLNLPCIAKEIAALKGESYEKVVAVTEENAKRLFRI